MENFPTKDLTTSSLNVESQEPAPSPLRKMVAVASIAAGVQFGWALQLSLLTPYVQLLGVPHTWSSIIWLCGPISGLVVQPIAGYYSDRCKSRFGRRRPFICAGAIAVAISIILIGFAADFGHSLGDDLTLKTRPRAVAFFVIGFWILDMANNMLQGPCRAFLGDLSAGNQSKIRTANSIFSFFMAVGNILGYAAGSYSKLYKVFPFTETKACDIYCANLKSCFFISIVLLIVLVIIVLVYVKEIPLTSSAIVDDENKEGTTTLCIGSLFGAFRELKRPMWMLLLVTCLNWMAWFPWVLYDTDWMGKEVYGGDVGQSVYDKGVHAGSLGLMFNSIVLAVMSLAIEPLSRLLGGVKRLWGMVNFILAIGLAMTVLITKQAEAHRQFTVAANGVREALPPPASVKGGALGLFSVLGIPLAITYSVPFALASIFSSTSGAGQGLSLGTLNLAIVIPQMIVSAISGPLDGAFGGGNLPAFVMGSIFAAVSGVLSIVLLPTPQPQELAKAATVGGFH
ncbi:hypothetical protein TanjilG_31988 [Lupinus angustifolius]|uniref:Uncharacterized protein n=1 Tax=Lupinus angustifolius TaxID=3871 RepID=A0A1J7H5B2_LUPAN|nr:PREDICTED: sucrose transport protein SUC9-like isoform X1 [Lupinus angustifolius]OIW07796.1 hypothetical protein TanjilG_31988 [Lupinus angustifolius]